MTKSNARRNTNDKLMSSFPKRYRHAMLMMELTVKLEYTPPAMVCTASGLHVNVQAYTSQEH